MPQVLNCDQVSSSVIMNLEFYNQISSSREGVCVILAIDVSIISEELSCQGCSEVTEIWGGLLASCLTNHMLLKEQRVHRAPKGTNTCRKASCRCAPDYTPIFKAVTLKYRRWWQYIHYNLHKDPCEYNCCIERLSSNRDDNKKPIYICVGFITRNAYCC